jgi:hypothetical protein
MMRPQAKPMMDTIWAGFLINNFPYGKKVWAGAFMKVVQFAGQWGICKGNPNSLDEQLFSQDLVRGNSK